MVSAVISHYRILKKLGAGGMGEVYLARDERLGRDVARISTNRELVPNLSSDGKELFMLTGTD